MADRAASPMARPSSMSLRTPDLEAAQRYYPAVFPWTLRRDAEEGGTASIRCAEALVAQLVRDRSGDRSPRHFTVHFAVANLGATLAAAVRLGASPVVEPGREGAPRVVLLVDPSGQRFGLELALDPPAWGDREDLGLPQIFTLHTALLEASCAFYAELLGWEFEAPEDPAVRHVGGLGGLVVMLRDAKRSLGDGESGYWEPSVLVHEVEAAARACEGAGGRIVAGGGAADHAAILADPYGTTLAVHQGP